MSDEAMPQRGAVLDQPTNGPYADDGTGNFRCPACGGRWFRTTDSSLEALMERGHPVACKDQYSCGCRWKGLMRAPGVRQRSVVRSIFSYQQVDSDTFFILENGKLLAEVGDDETAELLVRLLTENEAHRG